MKNLLALTFCLSFLVFGCKKKDDGIPSEEDIINLHNATVVNATARAQFLELAPQSGSPKQTLIQTLDWVLTQEGVTNAFHQDSTYLFIEMSSGLQTMLWINELDAEGKSKYRGGGSGQLKAMASSGNCSNVVENKDVLIYAPGAHEFGYEFRSAVPGKLDADSRLGTVNFLKDEQANVDAISTFSNYGLVLIETHGTAVSFMTGDGFYFGESEVPTHYRDFRDRLTEQIGEQNLERMINSELIIGSQVNYDPLVSSWWSENQFNFESGTFKLWASAKFLENSPSLSNTIVYGNFCFSGWTTIVPDYPKPIGKAILDLNPRTFYAYQTPEGNSRVVDNFDSLALEDSTITGLLNENDSTGNAHLKADGNPFQTTFANLYLVQLGQPDWCYEGCGGLLTDIRDGAQYETVCIGDQVWMAENLRYMPSVNNVSEFQSNGQNGLSAMGVSQYDGTSVTEAQTHQNYLTYGTYYNWYAIMDGQASSSSDPSGVRGLCPEGWHLPSKAEWDELVNHLGGGSEAGGKLKEAGTEHWVSPNTGATNESGFTALPAGSFHIPGFNHLIGENAYFWSATTDQGTTESAYILRLKYDANWTLVSGLGKANGYPCRCVKD